MAFGRSRGVASRDAVPQEDPVEQSSEPDPLAADSSLVAGRRADRHDTVPPGVRIAAAWSWRVLAIAGALALLLFLIIQLREIVIPLLIAILIAALLVPFVQFLRRHGWPK